MCVCCVLQVGPFISFGVKDKLFKKKNTFMFPTGTGPVNIDWSFNKSEFGAFLYMQFCPIADMNSALKGIAWKGGNKQS